MWSDRRATHFAPAPVVSLGRVLQQKLLHDSAEHDEDERHSQQHNPHVAADVCPACNDTSKAFLHSSLWRGLVVIWLLGLMIALRFRFRRSAQSQGLWEGKDEETRQGDCDKGCDQVHPDIVSKQKDACQGTREDFRDNSNGRKLEEHGRSVLSVSNQAS